MSSSKRTFDLADNRRLTRMRVHIVHDVEGNIHAISQLMATTDLEQAGSKFIKAGPIPGPGQHLVEAELDDEVAGVSLKEILDGHRWDHEAASFVRRDATGTSA
jgi:hypothetical protein